MPTHGIPCVSNRGHPVLGGRVWVDGGLPDHVWDTEERLERLLRAAARASSMPVPAPIITCPRTPSRCRRARVSDATAFFGVAFHELGQHWTGHATRLNRPLTGQRDSPAYAREELRAELASAFLGAELGIAHDLEPHAAYLDGYLELLRNDNREIFRAARDAQGIAELILDRHPTWRLQDGFAWPGPSRCPTTKRTPILGRPRP